MKPITLWRDEATSCDPERWRTYKVDDYQAEYAALTRAEYDALAAEAADARTLRAERDSLVKERDEAVRLATKAGVCELGAHNPNVASYCREWEARAEKAEAQRDAYISGREMQRDRADAATARADKAEALLREARDSVERDYFECDTRLTPEARKDRLARIDALLEGK